MREPGIREIREAGLRIARFVHRTPVLTSSTLDRMCGAELYFKCENFQKTGSFKIRGAASAVCLLQEKELERGVATHSSGNFAAALSLAARLRGAKAYLVMPESTPLIKRQAVESYGGEIVLCRATLEAREAGLAAVVERTGAVFIHPYNDFRVIAGQGTAALELLEDVSGLDIIVAPVGGGGLVSGTAIAAAGASPGTAVVAAEPEKADDAYQSFQAGRIVPAGNPETIADGLRTSLGSLTFAIIRKYVSCIVTVPEQGIVTAMRHLWERMKIVVEPSAAVPVAAVLKHPNLFKTKRIGVILSGGNVDLENLPWKPGPAPGSSL
jgi:threonine dehydratase